jgi:hypothetical protein
VCWPLERTLLTTGALDEGGEVIFTRSAVCFAWRMSKELYRGAWKWPPPPSPRLG